MNTHPFYPDVLLTTSYVADKIGTSEFKLIEVDLDSTLYGEAHLEGALLWDWQKQLRDHDTHEIVSQDQFELLMRKSGIANEDAVVLYGDNNNWFACWAFWLLKLYGHQKTFLMDGGAKKWFSEGREVTTDVPPTSSSAYNACTLDGTNKATVENIFESFFDPDSHKLLDVRSSYEYQGSSLGPVGTTANCAVAGHIPTAINIPWNLNCNPDGTFKSRSDLISLYASFGITPESSVITYCAIGERASLSWFVLKELLKFPTIMNYDRSMAQWTRIANAPIVTGEAA